MAVVLSAVRIAHAAPRGGQEQVSTVVAAIAATLDGKTAEIHAHGAKLMPACATQLKVSWLSDSGDYRTADVACIKPRWTLYVGVSVPKIEPVAVVQHAIHAGSPLKANDVIYKPMPVADLNGPAVTAVQINAGVIARTTLLRGTPVTMSDIDTPEAVHAGGRVSIVAIENGVSVEMDGNALQNGGFGQTVLVQNIETHRRVMADLARMAPAANGVYAVPMGPEE